jgi:RNA polymerase sigma factor (sigma-70 family)
MGYVELITRLKRKEPEALEEIIRQYNAYVATIVYNTLGGYADILDMQAVINSIFFTLWENAEKIDTQNYFDLKPYLGTIARNISLNEKKKNIFLTVNDDFSKIELRDMLLSALKELRTEYQIVLIKFYFQGKKIKQIAKEEHQSEATIKTWLKRSREQLKELLMRGGFIYEN